VIQISDLIERQAAIDAIYAEFEYVYCFNCDHEGNEEWCEDCHRKYMKWSASRNTIERVLNGLPSVQPRKGKWIRGDSEKLQGKWRCSVCNKTTYHICADFCPNCGADMRKRGDSE
jgi:hypothetical protein